MSPITLERAMAYSCRSSGKPEALILWIAETILGQVNFQRQPELWVLAVMIRDTVRPLCEPDFVNRIEALAAFDVDDAARN